MACPYCEADGPVGCPEHYYKVPVRIGLTGAALFVLLVVGVVIALLIFSFFGQTL
jgi:hypothetical protein